MNTSLMVNLAFLVILLHLSAFFAGAETVFFSLKRSELNHFRKSNKPLDKQVVLFLSKPKDFLVTILFGNELTNIAISVLVAGIFYQLFQDSLEIRTLTVFSVAVGTFLILVFGEIIPKSIGVLYAATLAPATAFLLKPLYLLLKPIRFLLVRLSNGFIRFFGGEQLQKTPLILEEELQYLLELGAKSGEVDVEEREWIQKAFAFRNKIVAEIMTPYHLVFFLPVDIAYEDLLGQIKATQFSRVPIRQANTDQIVGFFYVKDLFKFYRMRQDNKDLSIREILRPPLFVNQQSSLEEVLEAFKKSRVHMAIAIDSQGKPTGLITMHDVVEELFGEVGE